MCTHQTNKTHKSKTTFELFVSQTCNIKMATSQTAFFAVDNQEGNGYEPLLVLCILGLLFTSGALFTVTSLAAAIPCWRKCFVVDPFFAADPCSRTLMALAGMIVGCYTMYFVYEIVSLVL